MMDKEKKWLTINYINGVSESYYVLYWDYGFIFYESEYFNFQYKSDDKIIEMAVPYVNVKNFAIEEVT